MSVHERIRSSLSRNADLVKVFERNRGNVEKTLADLERKNLIGKLYESMDAAIDFESIDVIKAKPATLFSRSRENSLR